MMMEHLGHADAATLASVSLAVSLDPRARVNELFLPFGAALERADEALYEAKRQGRSRAVAAIGDEDRPVFTESQRLGLTLC